MIDLKPYGAFIENSLRPILEQADALFDKLEKNGFPLSKANIKFLLEYLFQLNIQILALKSVASVIITAIVCFTVLRLMQ